MMSAIFDGRATQPIITSAPADARSVPAHAGRASASGAGNIRVIVPALDGARADRHSRLRGTGTGRRQPSGRHQGLGGDTSTRAAGRAGGADRAVSRSAPRPDAGRVYLPARDHPAAAVDGEAPGPQGQGPRGFGREAALGPEHPVDGRRARSGEAAGGRHPVGHGARQRLPGAAGRRHGRGPADAQEGEGQGRPRVERAAEGRDAGRRGEDGHRGAADQSRGHLRADVQPGRAFTARRSIPIRRSTTRPIRRARHSSRSRSA